MTIDELKKGNLIIFEAISGSRAYGLDTPQSDTDIKGVFVLPEDKFYGFDYIDQVANETNDVVYYELKKFIMLLAKNNPTVLELIYSPAECISLEHPLFTAIKREVLLSKLCADSFARYAASQVKRARGLNKKIVNPMAREKKGVLDFCNVTEGGKTRAFKEWLEQREWLEVNCGLAKLEHFRDSYALYHSEELGLGGILRKEDSHDVMVVNIPKGLEPAAYLHFSRDVYKRYCRDYSEYWKWVEKRNEERYRATISHGKNYDAKNMMHTFRLLTMAKEIARDGVIRVKRYDDRRFFLDIREGKFDYEELLEMADALIREVEELFTVSKLPDRPDVKRLERLLIDSRRNFYSSHS